MIPIHALMYLGLLCYFTALRANTLRNRQRKTASASAILRPPATTNSATQGYRSQEMPINVTYPVLEMNRSDTLASFGEDYLENQAVDEGNVSLQNVPSGNKTDIYGTSGLYLGTDPGSPDTLRAPSFSAEARGMKSTTHLPNITVQDSKSPLSLVSLSPLTDGHMERKEANVNLQDPKWSIVTGTKDTFTPEGTTSAELSRSLIFYHTDPTGFTSQNPGGSIHAQTSLLKFVTQGRSSNIPTESRTSLIKDEAGSQSVPQARNPEHGSLDNAPKSPLQLQTVKSQIFPFYEASSSTPVSQFHTSSPHLIVPSNRQPSLAPSLSLLQPLMNKSLGVSSHYQPTSDLFKRLLENSPSELTTRQTSQHQQFHVTLTSSPLPARGFPQTFPQTTKAHAGIYHGDQRRPDKPPTALNQPSFQPRSQTTPSQPQTFGWKQTQPSAVPQSILPWLFTSRFDHTTPGKRATANIATTSPIVASMPRVNDPPFPVSTEQPTLHSSSHPSTHNMLKTSYLYHGRSSTMASIKTSFTHKSLSTPPSSSTIKKQPKTSPATYALPSSSPISTPPLVSSLSPAGTLSSSTKPSFYASLYSLLVPLSTSSSSPFTTSQYVTSSPFSSTRTTFSPTPSFISSASSAPHSSHSSPSISGSTSVSSFSNVSSSTTFSSLVSSGSTSPHPELSPVPRQFLYHLLTSTISPVASQQLTVGQGLQIQNHATPSEPWPKLNLPTQRTMVHPNPEPHPNLDPNFKLSADQKLNPNPPNTAVKPKHPSNPSKTPEKEGKYPDIVPRHNTWEVGLLLGCSAGLGMVLVAGLRYVYTQVCGKRTQVTLNDREREYSNRERGLIHVQECGDLVRVRRIRDNSFVLLAEYDILASPGD